MLLLHALVIYQSAIENRNDQAIQNVQKYLQTFEFAV